ncbi:MAG: hypothetical protein ACKOSS_05740 [Planctomycetia bacterium]
MSGPERRRAERHAIDAQGTLTLEGGRQVAVTIADLGELGALLTVLELEDAVIEGERALLDHPVLEAGRLSRRRAQTAGRVVRVELDFEPAGVVRRVALFFDGGAAPQGAAPARPRAGA